MKIIPGTNRRKKENDGDSDDNKSFTKKTSGEPKSESNKLKIPKSVTENPQKHRYQRSVRPITNGHIVEHSFTDEDGNYQRHEVFHETDPFESDEKESSGTFGRVKGL